MDRKLLDYLPPVLREVMEMRAINEANGPEIAIAWDALALVLANQFLETADDCGVAVWEKELKILPKDTDTLEERKAWIKAMWNRRTPYTLPWLRSWLTSFFGVDGCEAEVEDYTLTIRLQQGLSKGMSRKTNELFEALSAVIPANIWLVLENVFPTIFFAFSVTPRLLPRLSVSEPPPVSGGKLSVRVYTAPRLGPNYSTVSLPAKERAAAAGLRAGRRLGSRLSQSDPNSRMPRTALSAAPRTSVSISTTKLPSGAVNQ